jgi:hypothetical protein
MGSNMNCLMQPLRSSRVYQIFFYYDKTATLYQDILPRSGYDIVDQRDQSEPLPRSGYLFCSEVFG